MVGLPFKGNLLDNYQKTKFPIQIYFIPVSCYLLLIKNISFSGSNNNIKFLGNFKNFNTDFSKNTLHNTKQHSEAVQTQR